MSSLVDVSKTGWSRFETNTAKRLSTGFKGAEKEFKVGTTGSFDIKLNNANANISIVDKATNKVVASAKGGEAAASLTAKLAPGTYKAIISERTATAPGGKDVNLDITARNSINLTTAGATISGMARPLDQRDSGIQKSTVNVLQGGDFFASMSLPGSRWVMMDKDSKVVASGDTIKDGSIGQSFDQMKSIKLTPGQYEVVTVLPKGLTSNKSYTLDFQPKLASFESDAPKESEVSRLVRERQARLSQWAAEGSNWTAPTVKSKLSSLNA